MLAYALCNEAGAQFFNLSPANFPTTKGVAKLIQLVFYVARMRAPSVIYIDNVEHIFPAKGAAGGGKKAKKDPLRVRGKKMKKELGKAMKTILPTERVLVVGATSTPWVGDRNALAGFFDHAVYVPVPDYATRLALLHAFVAAAVSSSGAEGTATTVVATADAPVMSVESFQRLALVTEGLVPSQLKDLVRATLHPRRVQRLAQRPLDPSDFVHVLAKIRPLPATETAQMRGFHDTLPFTHRRANPPEDFKESEEELKKREAEQKKKKAKKSTAETAA